MPGARMPFVHEADLRLDAEADPAAVGAAVTTQLCGHWEHEGRCRWPHNNAIECSDGVAAFRTLFVAPAADEKEVRERIERALREGPGWAVLQTRQRPVAAQEQRLADGLRETKRPGAEPPAALPPDFGKLSRRRRYRRR